MTRECDHTTCKDAPDVLVRLGSVGTTRRYCMSHFEELNNDMPRDVEVVRRL